MSFKYEKNFSVAIDKINGNIKGALDDIGKLGAAESVARCPVGVGTPSPGNLRRSIGYDVSEDHVKIGTGPEAPYAEWVHNGTSRQRAQPFMQDAVNQNMEKIREIAKKHSSDM